ncbi:hypothetical protein ABB37_09748 [Leptomonas pyrrhocoris]|uniref:GPR1/FUN34/yaaH family n=1 Tax=Leptomonas pyrrhocoris TaxID=157538 RepID=A0A0M9FQ56_LEPPY|nr:hypothetical protein ABB37_09748 [Leptomonas pyrrhocoris]KPA73616.1 hypothetical protein ABB37_09748 [Leptomonas pyrrhocoris]|eukprot:XP_015652055.1 hypothetical protein ABB37_09748 [Leptomonas pyrrhocoris]
MYNDEELTLGTTHVSEEGEEVFATRNARRRSPVTDDDEDAAGRVNVNENHEPAAPAHAHAEAAVAPSHVLTNNKSPDATALPPHKQQPHMSDEQAAVIGESIMRALSGEEVLEHFLKKYPRPTPGSGVGVGPIKSTTQGKDRSGIPHAPNYQQKKVERIREKRRTLHELHDWEYQAASVTPRRANSAIVGLHSFGITFILFGLHYTGHFKLDTVVPSMTICFGGTVQLIAGLLAWVHGSTFAYVSFVSCGGFLLSITAIWMLPNSTFVTAEPVLQSSDYFVGAFYAIWGVYSTIFFFCTLRMNLCILLKVLTTALCFLCLAGGLMGNNDTATHAGGYFGIISGAVSWYLCFASLINEVWDMPIVPVFQITNLLDGAPLFGKKKEPTPAAEEEKKKRSEGEEEAENVAVKTHAEDLDVLPLA